jgi:hypothetical protein
MPTDTVNVDSYRVDYRPDGTTLLVRGAVSLYDRIRGAKREIALTFEPGPPSTDEVELLNLGLRRTYSLHCRRNRFADVWALLEADRSPEFHIEYAESPRFFAFTPRREITDWSIAIDNA